MTAATIRELVSSTLCYGPMLYIDMCTCLSFSGDRVSVSNKCYPSAQDASACIASFANVIGGSIIRCLLSPNLVSSDCMYA